MSRALLAVVAAFLVLLSGCAEQTEGTPTGGTTGTNRPPAITTDPGAPTESDDPPTGGDEPSVLADVDPCGLVDQSGLDSLGLTGGEEKEIGGARVCRWRHDGPSLDQSFTVSVEVFDSNGLADLAENTTVQQLPKVGAHDAVSFVDAAGVCGVSLGVGEDARVDSTAVGGDQQQGCGLAQQLATLVEPKLP
ncbi:DUF3558 domain-containing protein [Actinophytocola algeriensis]|uniref:DUF3558 domain-containing protein n=1 Tax=Actinophytocola algeriensis TaxID=1768010 RepID=A0A7W7VDR8_9PSEU|nr:DUF3558 domain-containing protein [Actinophytocola algeriensis]MBB4906447.1 hypothetical protein [Actinophytocola algeriensis]MBE1477928.1 hypothetical protein [Actinophytocola algeriensis]